MIQADFAKELLAHVAVGKIIVIFDDFHGLAYLVVAAEKATHEHLLFMAGRGRGIITVPMLGERLMALKIPLVQSGAVNSDYIEAFTVSVDYKRNGSGGGQSARDRAATVQALLSPDSKPENFVRPGHIFPTRYAPGGVFSTARAEEAAVDLVRMAGLSSAAVVCAIVADTGDMMNDSVDLTGLAQAHGLKMATVSDIFRLRGRTEKAVKRIASARLPTKHGEFMIHGYQCVRDSDEHVVLVIGDVTKGTEPVPAAFILGCVAGHVFNNQACQCGAQLQDRIEEIAKLGRGVLMYTPIQSVNRHLAEDYSSPPERVERLWQELISIQMLSDLGFRKARLMNDDNKVVEVPELKELAW